MPLILTESCAQRRPGPRPTIEVAAEVTKKIISVNEQAMPPPAFSLPKIGGATNFLPQEEINGDLLNDGPSTERDLRDCGGVTAASFTSSISSALDSIEEEHPLAAPPGWRRFWGVLTWENAHHPEVVTSSFCKYCYDEGLASSCSLDTREMRCQMNHAGECLFVISYHPHPKEDISIDIIPEYRMRKLARDRHDTIGSSLEIPTAVTSRTLAVLPRVLSKPETMATPRARPTAIPPERRPTYSRIRDTYEDIAWARSHDNGSKAGRMSDMTVEAWSDSDSPTVPTWVADSTRFQLAPRASKDRPRRPLDSPHRQRRPLKSPATPICLEGKEAGNATEEHTMEDVLSRVGPPWHPPPRA